MHSKYQLICECTRNAAGLINAHQELKTDYFKDDDGVFSSARASFFLLTFFSDNKPGALLHLDLQHDFK